MKKALQAEQLGREQSFKVKSLSFSPDAQQIVVLLEGSAVLFRVRDPPTVLGRFQSNLYDSFGWSPDGQVIHSGGHVVHLADHKACDLPRYSLAPIFMSSGSLIAGLLSTDRSALVPGTAHLRFYDTDCQEQDNWEVPGRWLIGDASPERGLLSVTSVSKPGPFPALIVNPFVKKVLHNRSGSNEPRGRFADSGTAICGRNICWDVDTGKKISEVPVSGVTSGVATRSSRVVLDYLHESVIPFSSVFTEIAARRVVWDLRSSKEVVSWRLKFLTYGITIDLDGFNRDRRPIPCAISPDGEYIVEGSDGKIWLYKIQP